MIAKVVITSIWSAQKLADRVFFHGYFHSILQENMRFVYIGDSNKYIRRMIYKNKRSKVSVTDALDGSYQVSL